MKNLIRNLVLLTVFTFAAAFDSCYVAPQLFEPAGGFSCINPKWLYESQWQRTGEWFVTLGLILSFFTFILGNQRTNTLIVLSIDKS
jgi:uncharacterized membrane protein